MLFALTGMDSTHYNYRWGNAFTPPFADYEQNPIFPMRPTPKQARRIVHRFWNSVAWVDAQLADFIAFLKAQGRYDNAIIIVTGDHGEEFKEQGSWFHGTQLNEAQTRVPILIKWLDCRERLSLQVHPPADIAPALRGEPKTENWYIAEAEPGASLIVGLKHGTSRADFAKALVNMTLEPCLHRFPVSAGDSILVRSGTVHAIDAGNLILEIQQNSDTTYRVYDWGRLGLDGKPRQMHVAESLASIDWTEFEPRPLRAAGTEAVIAQASEFTIRRVPLRGSDRFSLLRGQQPRLLNVVQGAVEVHSAGCIRRLERGATALVPFAGAFSVAPLEDSLLLITENFV